MSASCHCSGCSALNALPAIFNRPGLSALACRIGTHTSFFAAMKSRLTGGDFRVPPDLPPLLELKTRELSDPAIALLDAWALLGDVLTFYQERIANEGYLRTATERRSIVELAALVGFTLRPGVAASAYLAYTVDPASDTIIAAGSKVQSMPGPGQLPQTFETSRDLSASGGFSALTPRLTRPQLLTSDQSGLYLSGVTNNVNPNDPVLIVSSPPVPRRIANVTLETAKNRTALTLQPLPAPAGTVKVETAADTATPAKAAANDATSSAGFNSMGAIESLVPSLELAPAKHPANEFDLRRLSKDVFQTDLDTVPKLMQALHPAAAGDLYTALANATVAPAPSGQLFAFRVKAPVYGHNAPPKPITNSQGIVIGTEEWPLAGSLSIVISLEAQNTFRLGGEFRVAAISGGGSQAFISISQGGSSATGKLPIPSSGQKIGTWDVEISQAAGQGPPITIKIPKLGRVYTISLETPAQFKVVTDDPVVEVPFGQSATSDSNGRHLLVSAESGLLISDNAPDAPNPPNVISLDAVYEKIVPGSWVYIERADLAPDKQKAPTLVTSVAQVSLNNYGIPARVTQLTLGDPWLDPADRLLTVARKATVYAQSDKLPLAEEPIGGSIAKDTIELGSLMGGLQPGRWLIVSGERTDLPGIRSAELVMLASVKQSIQTMPISEAAEAPTSSGAVADPAPSPGPESSPASADAGKVGPPAPLPRPGESTHSTLQLASPLAYSYKPESVIIYGNVVPATHGETHKEVLGSGDSSQSFQKFKLHGSPLTYTSAATQNGAASTFAVFVNGIQWTEVDSLTTSGPGDRVFVTSTDNQDTVTVKFGDGVHGLRLPTGVENVQAVYRVGIGLDGNVGVSKLSMLATRPLGVRQVTNPILASGGAGRDSAETGRRNIPLASIALDRLVSVSDYASFARTFAGIGQATSALLPVKGRRTVVVSVAGAEGAVLTADSPVLEQLKHAFQRLGDPYIPIAILPIDPLLLFISARVQVLSEYQWTAVAPQVTAALQARFSFDSQMPGASVFLSTVIAAIQQTPGVSYCVVDGFDTISRSEIDSDTAMEKKFSQLATQTRIPASIPLQLEYVDPAGDPHPSGLAFLSADVPDTLLINEIPA